MYSRDGTFNQAGFSLVELLVSMTVMLVIMAVVFSLMGDAIGSSNVTYELTEAQQSLRTTQEYFNRDLTTTGDGLQDMEDIRVRTPFAQRFMLNTYEKPDPIPGPGFALLSLVNSDDNVAANVTEAANAAGTIPARTVRTATDRITMMTIEPSDIAPRFLPITVAPAAITADGTSIAVSAADAAQCGVGDILFISNGLNATFGTVTAIAGTNLAFNDDVYQLNTQNAGGWRGISWIVASAQAGQLITIRRMLIQHYFVDSTGLLHRRTFGARRGVGFTDSVIAEHVTNLQIRYTLFGLDETNNLEHPQPETQLTYTAVAPAIPKEPSKVRQVETAVTVETAHRVVNNQRATVAGTIATSMRNMQFREALQPD